MNANKDHNDFCCAYLASSMILSRQLLMCSYSLWKLPTTILITQSPLYSAGVQNPSTAFLILAATYLVSFQLTFPYRSLTLNVTKLYCTVNTWKRVGWLSMTLSRCTPFSECFSTVSRMSLRPQWAKVQQIFMELFLRAKPKIQSLQSTTSQLLEYWFLQKLNSNDAAVAPKEQFINFLSLTQNSAPPVPLNSSFVKFTHTESTLQSQFYLGLNFSLIQVEPRKAASAFTHIPLLLQKSTILLSISTAPQKVLPKLPPNQKGIKPFLISSQTIATNFSQSISQFLMSGLYRQGAAFLWQMSLIKRALCELM